MDGILRRRSMIAAAQASDEFVVYQNNRFYNGITLSNHGYIRGSSGTISIDTTNGIVLTGDFSSISPSGVQTATNCWGYTTPLDLSEYNYIEIEMYSDTTLPSDIGGARVVLSSAFNNATSTSGAYSSRLYIGQAYSTNTFLFNPPSGTYKLSLDSVTWKDACYISIYMDRYYASLSSLTFTINSIKFTKE